MHMKRKQASGKKEHSLLLFLRLIPRLFRATPLLFLTYQILSILHGASWGLEVLFHQRFFDRAADFAAGRAGLPALLLSLTAMGLITVLCQVLNGVANYMPGVLEDKARGRLAYEIHQKMARLSPITFEDTDALDHINKAEQGKNNAVWFGILFSIIFTFYIPYFFVMGWYLFSLKPVLAWSILLVFLPTALTQVLRTRVFAKLEDKSAPVRREYDYYESCMVGREYFKETRLLGGFRYFKRLYMDTLRLLNRLQYKANLKTNLAELGMKLLTVGGYFGILYMLFTALMAGDISVGAFAAVFSSIGSLYGIMEEVVCRHIGNLAQNLGTIKNYLRFLELEERGGEPCALPESFDIALKNVSFSYPKAEEPAVREVDLTIRSGETIALVGENGSGKSTLIRLITGLYLPGSGCVLYGDTPTGTLDMRSLFRHTSAVFQRYGRYQMTLARNIRLSDMERAAGEAALDTASQMAGVCKTDACYPDGYATMLSREFDGVDLSGGQWQRVAIARAFYREHGLIVLDEPTAAIDPLEETRIYDRFAQIAQNKTAVIVTHRLASVQLADRIVVMKDGRIVEIGTHEELMRNQGEYRRMFLSQQKWYQ